MASVQHKREGIQYESKICSLVHQQAPYFHWLDCTVYLCREKKHTAVGEPRVVKVLQKNVARNRQVKQLNHTSYWNPTLILHLKAVQPIIELNILTVASDYSRQDQSVSPFLEKHNFNICAIARKEGLFQVLNLLIMLQKGFTPLFLCASRIFWPLQPKCWHFTDIPLLLTIPHVEYTKNLKNDGLLDTSGAHTTTPFVEHSIPPMEFHFTTLTSLRDYYRLCSCKPQ